MCPGRAPEGRPHLDRALRDRPSGVVLLASDRRLILTIHETASASQNKITQQTTPDKSALPVVSALATRYAKCVHARFLASAYAGRYSVTFPVSRGPGRKELGVFFVRGLHMLIRVAWSAVYALAIRSATCAHMRAIACASAERYSVTYSAFAGSVEKNVVSFSPLPSKAVIPKLS